MAKKAKKIKEKKVLLTIRLPKSTIQELKLIAKSQNRSVSGLIRGIFEDACIGHG